MSLWRGRPGGCDAGEEKENVRRADIDYNYGICACKHNVSCMHTHV